MKWRWIAIAALAATATTVAPAQVEDHAPTVEQCRADVKLWHAEIQAQSLRDQPSYTVMWPRVMEMTSCSSVDPENEESYNITAWEILGNMSARYSHYIQRDGMWKQFLAEDAPGKR